MDLNWQIDIINGLIKENPESTIKDFFEVLKLVETISPDQSNEDMNTPKLYTAEQAEFIVKYCDRFSAKHIAEHLGLPEAVVYNFGSRHNLSFAKAVYRRKGSPAPLVKLPILKDETVPTEYSNQGYLSLQKKYEL